LVIMKGAFFYILQFIFLWIILSTQMDPFYLVSGLICSVISLKLLHMLHKDQRAEFSASPRFILYIGWLFKEIFISAIKVTAIVWSPKLQIDAQMRYINTRLRTRAKKVLFASSITLTPGTISIDLNDDAILVHALDKNSLVDLDQGVMEERIGKL